MNQGAGLAHTASTTERFSEASQDIISDVYEPLNLSGHPNYPLNAEPMLAELPDSSLHTCPLSERDHALPPNQDASLTTTNTLPTARATPDATHNEPPNNPS